MTISCFRIESSTRRYFRLLSSTSALIVLFLAGCAKKDPLALQVDYASKKDFGAWKVVHASDLPPEVSKDLDQALQDLQWEIRMANDGVDTRFVEDATRDRVDGRTVKEVIQLGLTGRHLRLQSVIEEFELSLAANQKRYDAAIKTGEEETLRFRFEDFLKRREKALGELKQTEERLKALGAMIPENRVEQRGFSLSLPRGLKAGKPADDGITLVGASARERHLRIVGSLVGAGTLDEQTTRAFAELNQVFTTRLVRTQAEISDVVNPQGVPVRVVYVPAVYNDEQAVAFILFKLEDGSSVRYAILRDEPSLAELSVYVKPLVDSLKLTATAP